MSSTDNRIVKMGFENAQFEKGIQQTIESLDQLKKSLDLDDAIQNMAGLKDIGRNVDLSGISSGVDTIASKFTTLGIIGVTALQNITNSAMNAGKRIVSALTIDPIATGKDEYELKMGSIQTIMAGTGESLDTVNQKLAELNEYSDRTIYSFADMTSNIGKFTNAGVKLDRAVGAIQGISNVAAISGANANEASRAMYNFSQALSAGYVKFIDWKSIENANMATVGFKTELIDSAVAAGTLTKQLDGTYKTLKGTVVTATRGFNESLQDQWMTSEALIDTLSRYSDDTTEIGKKAFAAAQDIKTFSQLYDTLKEAAQSGWATSWELIIGDFEEAKVLLSGVSEVIGGFIGASADARNSLLRDWKGLGGRALLISALADAFHVLMDTLKPIKEAFKEIFPSQTGQQLFDLTRSLKKLIGVFKMEEETAQNIKTTFKGLFSVVRLIADAFRFLFGILVPSAETFDSFGDGFWAFTASLSGGLIKLTESIKASENLKDGLNRLTTFVSNLKNNIVALVKSFNFTWPTIGEGDAEHYVMFSDALKIAGENIQKYFSKGLGAASSAIQTLTDGIKNLRNSLSEIADWSKTAFGPLGDEIASAFEGVTGTDILGTGMFAGIGFSVLKVTRTLGEITEVIERSGKVLHAYQNSINAKALISIAIAIGILAASLIALSFVNPDNLTPGLLGLSALLGEMVVTLKVLSEMKIRDVTGAVFAMLILSTAILMISKALNNLSDFKSWDASLAAITGITALLGGLVLAIQKINKMNIDGPNMIATAAGIFVFAAAIGILAHSVSAFAKMTPGELVKGLTAMGAVLVGINVFLQTTKFTDSRSQAATIIALAVSLLALYLAVKLFGNMDPQIAFQGMLSIAMMLSMLSAMLLALDSVNTKSSAATLLGIAAALFILMKPIKMLGEMDPAMLAQGLIAMALVLGGLTLALTELSAVGGQGLGLVAIGAALVGMATALFIVAAAMKIVSGLSWKGLAVGLAALLIPLAAMVGAAVLLAPLAPALVVLSIALGLLGGAAYISGLGLLKLSIGLGAFAALSAVQVTAIMATLGIFTMGLATLIPKALVAFLDGMAKAATAITKSLEILTLALLDSATRMVPAVVNAISIIITNLLNVLTERTPEFMEAAVSLLVAFLQGLSDQLPRVIQAGWDFIISFINGLADSIDANAPLLIDAIEKLILAVLGAAVDAILGGVDLLEKAGDIIMNSGLWEGISHGFKSILEWVVKIPGWIIEKILEGIGGFFSLGSDMMDGMLKGLSSGMSAIKEKAKEIGGNALDALKEKLGIASPSKEFAKVGKFMDLGLIDGLSKFASKVKKASSDVGESAKEGLNKSISNIGDLVDGNLDVAPTIKPVLDLTNVDSEAARMNGMFGQLAIQGSMNHVSAINSYDQKNIVDDIAKAVKLGLGKTEVGLDGTLRVEVVNDNNEVIGIAEKAVEDLLRRESR